MIIQGTDSLRMWGHLLRHLRIAAGISHEQLADHVGYSTSLVMGIEDGTRMPSPTFVVKADECVGAKGLLVDLAAHLTRQRFAPLPEEYEEEEARARTVWAYDSHLLHALLRTPAYARAVLAASCPAVPEEEIEERLSTLLRRQELLARQPAPALSFVVEEWVLRRATGGRAAMAEQLHHLLALSHLRHITVQVMPLSYEAHAGVEGPMTLLGMPEHKWRACLEASGAGLLIDEPGRVLGLLERYAMIRCQALTPADSATLIRRLAASLADDPSKAPGERGTVLGRPPDPRRAVR